MTVCTSNHIPALRVLKPLCDFTYGVFLLLGFFKGRAARLPLSVVDGEGGVDPVTVAALPTPAVSDFFESYMYFFFQATISVLYFHVVSVVRRVLDARSSGFSCFFVKCKIFWVEMYDGHASRGCVGVVMFSGPKGGGHKRRGGRKTWCSSGSRSWAIGVV